MDKSRWAATAASGLCLVLASFSSGCSGKADYSLNQPHGDVFSSPDRGDKIKNLKSDYNANIVIEDQSYESDHDVNRVLRYLAENEDTLKPQLTDVVEIDIVGSSVDGRTSWISISSGVAWREVGNGKFAVSIDCHVPQQELDVGFKMFNQSHQGTATLSETGARLGISIVDYVGMTNAQAQTLSDNLTSAAKGFDFTSPAAHGYVTTVQADRIFAMGPHGSGLVLVQFDAGSDALATFLGSALDFGKHIDRDLLTVSTLLGVSVVYQPDTLMPDEISQGITSLTAAAKVFRASTRSKKTIMIGRRTESDILRAQSASQLLVAFDITPDAMTAALNLLPKDNSSAIQAVVSTAVALYAQSGVTLAATAADFGVTDMTVDSSVQVIQDLVAHLERVASPSNLANYRITSIARSYWNAGSSIDPNYDGSAVLRVNFASLDDVAVGAALTGWEGAYLSKLRLATQKGYLSSLGSHYPGVGIQYGDANLDVSSDDRTQQLSATLQILEKLATPAILSQIGVTMLSFAKGAASATAAVLLSADRSTLTIDPYQATSDVFESVLSAALVPLPTPSPTSTARPAL